MKGLPESVEVVSIIGTLPPIKGISPYCSELALMLARDRKVDFINFRKIYPERLYPGGTRCHDLYPVDLNHPNLEVRDIITWYNPLSWIRAGFAIKGRKVIAQWWAYPLAPIYLVILAIARLRGKKISITVHNVEPHESNRLSRLLNGTVLPLADTLIVHTQDNKDELVRRGWEEKKIEVVPHPLLKAGGETDIESMDKEEARRALGLSNNHNVLCFFGNIREYKGLDNLLLALADLRKFFPDIRLIIAGQPWGNWARYQAIIEESGLEPLVISKPYFLPFHELACCLKASDLVVFPFKEFHSASGSLSLALGMGCDVLCTRNVMTEERENVFVVEDSSPDAIAEGVLAYFLYQKQAPLPAREAASVVSQDQLQR